MTLETAIGETLWGRFYALSLGVAADPDYAVDAEEIVRLRDNFINMRPLPERLRSLNAELFTDAEIVLIDAEIAAQIASLE